MTSNGITSAHAVRKYKLYNRFIKHMFTEMQLQIIYLHLALLRSRGLFSSSCVHFSHMQHTFSCSTLVATLLFFFKIHVHNVFRILLYIRLLNHKDFVSSSHVSWSYLMTTSCSRTSLPENKRNWFSNSITIVVADAKFYVSCSDGDFITQNWQVNDLSIRLISNSSSNYTVVHGGIYVW